MSRAARWPPGDNPHQDGDPLDAGRGQPCGSSGGRQSEGAIDASPNEDETENTTPPEDRANLRRQIRDLVRRGGCETALADDLIDREASLEEARSAVLEAMLARGRTPIRTASHNAQTLDNPEVRIRAIGEALYTRVDPSHQPSEAARAFIGLSIPELIAAIGALEREIAGLEGRARPRITYVRSTKMVTMKNYVQPGNTITLTAPTGGVASGAGVLVGTLFGVCAYDAAAGAEVEVEVVGVFELAKASGAITEGAKVYWDATAKNVTTTASGNTLVGAAVRAAATGDAKARIRLNGVTTP